MHDILKPDSMLGAGLKHRQTRFVTHTTLPHHHFALPVCTTRQCLVLALLLAGFIALTVLGGWRTALIAMMSILTLMYFSDLLFTFLLIMRSFRFSQEIIISEEEISATKEASWPTYSILCPLYKEEKMVQQFVRAIARLDYPKRKMEVLLLLEEDDQQTRKAVQSIRLPAYFRVLVVPHSLPKTKPKALNYGLHHATGAYAVVYDAEDIPDPQQLKKAVIAFRKTDRRTICMQAKLNFYNPHHNILTRVFTAEYALWFNLVLPGLQTFDAPLPLGGTSNHFRTKDLRHLKGWDPFNVTEDCDLGIRLHKRGYRTAMFNSVTLEEANSQWRNWLRQRSRWIKGYIQTYLVHMRRPAELLKEVKRRHILSFQLTVGGKITSILINPFMWGVTVSYFVFRPIIGPTIESIFPAPIFYVAVLSLVIGNFLHLYCYMIGCAKNEQWNVIAYVFVVPLYWLMMSIAAWIACHQLIVKPHFWEKTHHGFHLESAKTMSVSIP